MKRALQIAVAAGGIVPVAAGLSGIILGPSLAGATSQAADLDVPARAAVNGRDYVSAGRRTGEVPCI